MTAGARGLLMPGVVLVVLLAGTLAAQQTPVRDNGLTPRAAGTATLSGTVVNDVTNQPVRRAVVSLSSADNALRVTAVTDDTGTFAFAGLPDNQYLLSASKPSYVGVSYGARKRGRPGTTIALTPGQQRAGVTLRLPPGAVIAGTVRNRSGEPVPDARVIVLRSAFGYDTGERTLWPVGGALGQATDDQGTYRIFGLPADDYYIVVTNGIGVRRGDDLREITVAEVEWATRQLQLPGGTTPAPAPAPPPGRSVDAAPVFYPGVATQAGASMVTLKAGEEHGGVDILLDVVPTARIVGTVVSPSGELPPGLQVNVIAHDTIPGVPFSGFGSASVNASGRFNSGGLPPGDYTVTVRVSGAGGRGGPPAAGAAALFGMTTIAMSGSDVDTTVTLESGVAVSGRLVFEGNTLKPPADLTKIRVSLTAVRSKIPSLGVPAVNADAAGAFTFPGVTPGRYRLTAVGTGGWQVKSAVVDGRDTLDTPIDIGRGDVRDAAITFTDLVSEISGDLLDTAGHPAPGYFIIVFPVDQTYWVPQSRRIQSTRPASDGKFRVQNLPPGEYFISAVTDVEQGEWYDPSFLAQLVGASTKLTLTEGEKKVQSLRIQGTLCQDPNCGGDGRGLWISGRR